MSDVPEQPGSAMSRRTFIVLASRGLAAGTVGVPLLLEACTPTTPPAAPTSAPAPPAAKPTTAAPAAGATAAPAAGATAAPAAAAQIGGVKLPTYNPFMGPKPDPAGNSQRLDPASYKFPADLIKSIPQPPGDG